MSLKTIIKHNSIRLLIILLSSILFTIIVNSIHPAKLPLFLTEGKRPGIPKGSWQEKIRYIDMDDIVEEISTGNVIIIDLRDSENFNESHAIGAINLHYYEFEELYPDFAEQISEDQSVFILCEGMLCGMSAHVAKKLMDLGYDNLAIIKQGFEGWEKYYLPIEENTGKREEFDGAK